MPDPVVWPQIADRTCSHCRARHVVVTAFADGVFLCSECQEMPSRREMFRTSKETGA